MTNMPSLSRRRALIGLAATAGTALLAACGADSSATSTTGAPQATGTGAAPATAVPATAAPAATTAPAASAATAMLTAPAATTGTTNTISAPAAAKAIEIEVSHVYAGDTHPMALLIKAFNDKNMGVKVTSRVDGTDYQTALQKAQASLAAGKPPAVVTTGWKYASFAEAALGIVGLDEVGGSETKDIYAHYPDNVLKIVTIKNKVIGLPFALSTPILYYNQDIFKMAGLDPNMPPADWDEAYAFAAQIKAKTSNQPLGMGINEWTVQSFIQNNGGDVLDDNGKVAFDAPAALGGIKTWVVSSEKGYFTPAKDADLLASWSAGNMGMFASSVASLGTIRTSTKAAFTTAMFPAIAGKPRRMQSGGNFLGVYARDKDQRKAAWEFLKYVSSEEGERIWVKTGYMNPTKFMVDVVPGQEPAYAQLADGLTTETIWPGPKGLEALKVYNDWGMKWITGTSVDDTIKQAKSEIAALLP